MRYCLSLKEEDYQRDQGFTKRFLGGLQKRHLGKGGVQRHLWVSEGFRDIVGSVIGSGISLVLGGVQVYLWSVRGSGISLVLGGVQGYLWVSEGFRDIFGSARGSGISLGL